MCLILCVWYESVHVLPPPPPPPQKRHSKHFILIRMRLNQTGTGLQWYHKRKFKQWLSTIPSIFINKTNNYFSSHIMKKKKTLTVGNCRWEPRKGKQLDSKFPVRSNSGSHALLRVKNLHTSLFLYYINDIPTELDSMPTLPIYAVVYQIFKSSTAYRF